MVRSPAARWRVWGVTFADAGDFHAASGTWIGADMLAILLFRAMQPGGNVADDLRRPRRLAEGVAFGTCICVFMARVPAWVRRVFLPLVRA